MFRGLGSTAIGDWAGESRGLVGKQGKVQAERV